jgi:hypothetical protein
MFCPLKKYQCHIFIHLPYAQKLVGIWVWRHFYGFLTQIWSKEWVYSVEQDQRNGTEREVALYSHQFVYGGEGGRLVHGLFNAGMEFQFRTSGRGWECPGPQFTTKMRSNNIPEQIHGQSAH